MKKLLTAVLLCTVLTFSACSVSGNGETDNFAEAAVNKEDTEESFSSGSSSLTKSTSAALTSEISVSPPAETVQKKNRPKRRPGRKRKQMSKQSGKSLSREKRKFLSPPKEKKQSFRGSTVFRPRTGCSMRIFPIKRTLSL